MKFTQSCMRLRRRGGAIVHDLLMIPIAWLGALWLRFNLGSIKEEYLDQALHVLPALVVVLGLSFLYFGMYRGVWRLASLPDFVRILKAVFIGVCLCIVVTFALTRMTYVSRSSFLFFAGLLIVLLSTPRFTYRWAKDRHFHSMHSRQALVVGAGRGGEMLARTLLAEPSYGYRPIGFVDDDPEKIGRDVYGLRVFGHCGQIPEIVVSTGADIVIVAMPSANAVQMRKIVEVCERSGVLTQTIPNAADFTFDDAVPGKLRPVTIEDLLDRKTVRFDWSRIRGELIGRSVLVTGGGGSIGSELCRQIVHLDPSRLIVVDTSEFNLYRIERELRDARRNLPISIMLADVCDAVAIERIFERHHPDIVFHTAAYKHVPMLESQTREAVRVNVLGTHTMAHAAARHATGRFVLISSDKAVNPANVMGESKRLAEKVCRAVQETSPSTRFIAVRFGNVLDSTGSVVPLFREQIARGGPVTVTDRNMERYFMTIHEACQLVMASAVIGEGGEMFVLDMGEPMRILYLAEQMIRLSGKIPHEDIAIEFIGARPGEKYSEDLAHSTEPLSPTSHEKIHLARQQSVDPAGFEARLADLRKACEAFDEPALERTIAQLVPEYLGASTTHTVEQAIPIDRARR